MTLLQDIINNGFSYFDNQNRREYEIALANAQANTLRVQNATETTQNPNAVLGLSKNQVAFAGLGLIAALFLGIVAYKALD